MPERPASPPTGQGAPTTTAVYDPSRNVLDLVEAANRRQDDLRTAAVEKLESELAGVKEYFRDLATAGDKAVNAALTAADRAVSKAEASAEKRFEGVDKFRLELGEQQRLLMPRSEAESRLATLHEKIDVLEKFRTETLSKGNGMQAGWAMAVGVAGVVLTILSIVSVVIMVVTRFARP